MNSRLQNQLNMVGACLSLAQSADYKPVWTGKPPADFATDLAVQFDGTADGHRFLEAWKRARLIVDSGGGQSAPPPPTPAAK